MTIVHFLLADLVGLFAIVGFSRLMAVLLSLLIRYVEKRG